MPTVFSYNENIDKRYVDLFNEILINSYSSNEVNKYLIDAWKDFMINGLGILKLNGNFDSCVSAEVIPANSVIFDYSNINSPQFFIHEKIMSVDSACKQYDIDQKKYNYILGKPSIPKILTSQSSWDYLVENKFSEPAEGEPIKSKNLQDIFSPEFTKNFKYEVPSLGLNVIREEYRRAYIRENKELLEIYERNVFLNDTHISTTNMNSENFPFIILHNYRRDTLCIEEAFPCFVDQVKGDILLYNTLYNQQVDGVVSSSALSSTVIMDSGAVLDGKNKSNRPDSSLNIIKVKSTVDKTVNDVFSRTPPVDMYQSIQNEMQLCLNRIKSDTGLMDFETPVKSGFQTQAFLESALNWCFEIH